MLLKNPISWLVILIIVIGLPAYRVVGGFKRALTAVPTTQATSTTGPTTKPLEAIDMQTLVQGKYTVATAMALPASRTGLVQQLTAFGKKPMQQVATAVLAGELVGKEDALVRLAPLAGDADADAFAATYSSGVDLPASVKERYEFFADLAAVNGKPDTDPQRAAVLADATHTLKLVAGFGFIVVGAGVVGFGLLVTGIVLLALGHIRPNVAPPERLASSAYVQAFAIYLSLLIGASVLVIYVLSKMAPDVVVPDAAKYSPLLLAVLIAVAWPFMRGVPWSQIREDWGLHLGRGLLIEPLAGIGGYLAGLPIIGLGILITTVLAKLTGSNIDHPIVKDIAAHPYAILFLAVVFAPITEETLFRGAFLSHLREYFNPWVAALLCGLVFAAIHPQGWAAIPALGSIGFVLAMIRQWRRTLLASMTAHALNNGVVLAFALLLLK